MKETLPVVLVPNFTNPFDAVLWGYGFYLSTYLRLLCHVSKNSTNFFQRQERHVREQFGLQDHPESEKRESLVLVCKGGKHVA